MLYNPPDEIPTLSPEEKILLLRGKVITLIIIGFATLLASLIPWVMEKTCKAAQGFLSIGSSFASGIILGAAFSHALPDARESFENYFSNHEVKFPDYPYAELITVGILLLLLGIDKVVVHALEEKISGKGNGHSHGHNHFGGDKSHESDSEPSTPDYENMGIHNRDDNETTSSVEEAEYVKQKAKRITQAYVLLGALSLHSIFDGLGLGAEQDVGGFYGLLITIVAHKILDGFALGVPIYNAKFSMLWSVLYLSFAALMTPLGIGIGMAGLCANYYY
eukprot:TRINITY_DN1490_c0_g1_i3.p1 TRINITY_DN1490_c0_g1~~TRINITY_DN1490_c0_g1_i3.p1  ORF type:complete len:278 (-),score=53.78 TRINITY_DN1490_c0_g1_i3:351-1184(-)